MKAILAALALPVAGPDTEVRAFAGRLLDEPPLTTFDRRPQARAQDAEQRAQGVDLEVDATPSSRRPDRAAQAEARKRAEPDTGPRCAGCRRRVDPVALGGPLMRGRRVTQIWCPSCSIAAGGIRG